MNYVIAPSIFGANLGKLEDEIRKMEENNVELIHLDVMDGHFVEKMAFGPDHIKAIKSMTKIPIDVHLMVEKPERIIDSVIKSGADIITIHVESSNRLNSCVEKIKNSGIKAGIVLSPQTSEHSLKYLIDKIDMVLVMTINPGEDNLGFNNLMLDKIKNIKKMIGDREIDIEVDGSINNENIIDCKDAGANIFVVGSYLFKGDFSENLNLLRERLD
ncbi:ribulose-phosphate 3-epimerase [uncultured Anaerococcus sp.]|uniref:ribulose-phosphate 3-epimerase n=1 Tax=uncultured Anaerococcus sp. TaxID=293428 RepID=UPI00262B6621|nr:ribulose-phosphate 3-epimerase [uncultured Anaerococcus sp.]